jgi:O-antigen ligase
MVVGSAIASNSRGALLGLAVGTLWLIISSRRRITALIVAGIATIAVIAAIPQETMRRFDTAGEDLTSESRLTYWQYGIETVRENPLLGVGFQNWVPYLFHVHPEAFAAIGRVEVIHNTYLQVSTELGLLGLTIYIAALLYVFWLNLTAATKASAAGDTLLSATATGLNGSLAVYLVTSSFMSVFLYPYLWVLLALSAACASAARDTHQSRIDEGRRQPPRGRSQTRRPAQTPREGR